MYIVVFRNGHHVANRAFRFRAGWHPATHLALSVPVPSAMADAQAPILADHDGFVEAFYHLLWAKNFNGEPCPEILVPDTIIYKFRIPAYWYDAHLSLPLLE